MMCFIVLFFFSILQELKKHDVSTVVRVCEPSYKIDELKTQGIVVRDLAFEDGTFPPQNVVDEWFEILRQKYVSFSSFFIIFLSGGKGLGEKPGRRMKCAGKLSGKVMQNNLMVFFFWIILFS